MDRPGVVEEVHLACPFLSSFFFLLSFCPVLSAFAHGSVRFLKDTIDFWPFDPATGDPTCLDVDARGV
jgi:hypothetical protein